MRWSLLWALAALRFRSACGHAVDLIGGIQMTLMGVVRPGDNIEIGSETGVVTDVGLRHTTIITKLGETVIVPNSVISKTSLVQLPPAEQFKVPFCATGDASKLDEIAAEIAERAKAAAESVSPVTQDPKVFFSEITEYGFRGSIVMRVEDSAATGRAADAVVRAIAPAYKVARQRPTKRSFSGRVYPPIQARCASRST